MKNLFIILSAISLFFMMFCFSCARDSALPKKGDKCNLTVYIPRWDKDSVDFVRMVLTKKGGSGSYFLVQQGDLYEMALIAPSCGQISNDCLTFPMVVGEEYKLQVTNHFKNGTLGTDLAVTFTATFSCSMREYSLL